MLGQARSPHETSALISKQYGESSTHEPQPGKRAEKVVCDHCNKPWHTRDKCWELHGNPASMRNNRPTTRWYTTVEDNYQPRTAELPNFTKEQLARLITSGQPSNTSTSSTSLVNKGNFPVALTSVNSLGSWIMDSGVTDHMTGCPQLFSTYFPCSGKDKITIVDGSLSPLLVKVYTLD